MANPTKIATVYPDGFNLYGFVRRESDGFIYDVGDAQFEAVGTWDDARAGECDISFTNYKGNLYMMEFPSITVDKYIVIVCLRGGANPAINDAGLGNIRVPSETVLMADGLDSINNTEPSGAPSGWNFRQKLLWLFGRFAYKHTRQNDDVLKTHQSDGTELTKQATSKPSGLQKVEKIQAP